MLSKRRLPIFEQDNGSDGMIKWVSGDDYIDDGADYKTYGIDKSNGSSGRILHGNCIEVYTSEEDRDAIVAFLNDREKLRYAKKSKE